MIPVAEDLVHWYGISPMGSLTRPMCHCVIQIKKLQSGCDFAPIDYNLDAGFCMTSIRLSKYIYLCKVECIHLVLFHAKFVCNSVRVFSPN